MLLGLDPQADAWLAWQLRRAVFAFGDWFDRQREATVERPAPKHQKPMIRVPKYDEAQLRAMLGIDGADGTGWAGDGPDPLDVEADLLLRGVVG